MADWVSLGISLFAIIIAIVSIILSLVMSWTEGPQGPPGASTYSSYEEVPSNSSIMFNSGTIFNVSGSTNIKLLGPGANSFKSGDTITLSNAYATDVTVNVDTTNGGYCYWDSDGLVTQISVPGRANVTLTVTGNNSSCVEIYQKGLSL